MATTLQRAHLRTPLSVEMLAGIWLILSPFLLPNINTEALWSFLITGIVIFGAAITQRRDADTRWPTWITMLAGIWLVLAPLIVPYTSTATWNGMITGVVVLGMSLWAMQETGSRDRYDEDRNM